MFSRFGAVLLVVFVVGGVGCKSHGSDSKAGKVDPDALTSHPRSITVAPSPPPDKALAEAFSASVSAKRVGRDVKVAFSGALPADGNYYFRFGGFSPDTLRVAVVDRQTTAPHTATAAPTQLSLVVPGVPSTVTTVVVTGPSAGYGSSTVPLN